MLPSVAPELFKALPGRAGFLRARAAASWVCRLEGVDRGHEPGTPFARRKLLGVNAPRLSPEGEEGSTQEPIEIILAALLEPVCWKQCKGRDVLSRPIANPSSYGSQLH